MRIDMGKDLEAALNMYTDVRASFGNISEVVENLVKNRLNIVNYH
jgi:hypothetical protein